MIGGRFLRGLKMLAVQDEILCSKTHEYVLEQNGIYTIGLTDHFINKLGEIMFLELAEPNTTLVKGEAFGTIQGVDTSKDLYMPIGGTILEINEDVVANYDSLHETTWLIKIESATATQDSIDLFDYDDYIEEV